MGSVREVQIAGKKLQILERCNACESVTGIALTGSWVWEAAFYLSEWIAGEGRTELDLAGKTVVELGAGTGLPGMAAALLGAERVILTDLAPLLPGLRQNVEANGLGEKVEVLELAWGMVESESIMEGLGEVDVVLMSDVFYDPSDMPGLAKTLRGLCGRETRIWSASEIREMVWDCLEVLVKEGFRVLELPERCRLLSHSLVDESSQFAVFLIMPPVMNMQEVVKVCRYPHVYLKYL